MSVRSLIMAAAGAAPAMSWTSHTLPISKLWNSGAYGAGLFVLGNGSDTTTATSPDCVTWTQRTGSFATSRSGLIFGAVFFGVASGASGQRSTDGITWTAPLIAAANTWGAVCYSGSQYVTVTPAAQNAATSPDASTWTLQSGVLPGASNTAIAYGGGTYVVVGNSAAASSTNGTSWTSRTIPAGNYMSVAYGAGLFVAVGAGVVATSPDGITWTARSGALTQAMGVAFGNGQFAMVENASGQRVATSPDGINWTTNATAFPSAITAQVIIFGNGKFVVPGANSTTVMTSP